MNTPHSPNPHHQRHLQYQRTIHRLRMEELVLAIVSVVLIVALVICGIVINNLNKEKAELTDKLKAAGIIVTSGEPSAPTDSANGEATTDSTASAVSSQSASTVSTTPPPETSWTDTDQDGEVDYPYAVVEPTQKTCYLTFDDGPSNNTLKILDILKQYNVKATFFVVGDANLDYLSRIHNEGHAVALHAYSHTYSQIYQSTEAYFADLKKISDAVKAKIGVESKVIRFPGGSSNTVSRSYCSGIMTELSQETLKRGYVYFDWNVDSIDASGNNVPVEQLIENIQRYGGHSSQDVVLMHDTGAKGTTVEALPSIIEYYQSQGYTFAPITVNTPPCTHGINN